MPCRALVYIKNYWNTELVHGLLKIESIIGYSLMRGQRVWTVQETVFFPDNGCNIVFNKFHSIYWKKTPNPPTNRKQHTHTPPKAYGRPQNKASFLTSNCNNLRSASGSKRTQIKMENAQPILHKGHHTIKKQAFYTESNLKEPDSSQKRSARPRPPEAAPGGDRRFPTWGSGPGALGPSLLLPRAAAGPALLPARQPGLRGMSTTRLRRPRHPLSRLRRSATARPALAGRRPGRGGAGRASPQPRRRTQ